MSPGAVPLLIAMATVGVALAALIIGLFTWLRADMRGMEDRIRIDLGNRIDRLEQGQGELRERMAHLEGLLEGLREAIVARAA